MYIIHSTDNHEELHVMHAFNCKLQHWDHDEECRKLRPQLQHLQIDNPQLLMRIHVFLLTLDLGPIENCPKRILIRPIGQIQLL